MLLKVFSSKIHRIYVLKYALKMFKLYLKKSMILVLNLYKIIAIFIY